MLMTWVKRFVVRWFGNYLRKHYFSTAHSKGTEFSLSHLEEFRRIVEDMRLVRCDVKGHSIVIHAESDIEQFRAMTYATKEPETLEWIERYFRPGDVMYDVGANIGLYSLFAAKHLTGKCKVYSFEPEAMNHAMLNRNIVQNGLSSVVIPCCMAIADRVSFAPFYLNPDNFENAVDTQGLSAGSALHAFGVAEDYRGHEFTPFHVQGTVGATLDYLWQEWGLDFPNHIKVDVDGLEEKVIAGASHTLADSRVRSVLVEISGKDGDADPIAQILVQEGFQKVTEFVAHSSDQLRGTKYEGSVNNLFVR